MQMGDKLTCPRLREAPVCWGRSQTEALEYTSGPETPNETLNAAEREVEIRILKQIYITNI